MTSTTPLDAARVKEIEAMYRRPVELADAHSLREYIDAVRDLLADRAHLLQVQDGQEGPPETSLDAEPSAALLRTDAKAYRASLYYPDTNEMFTENGKNLAYQWQDKKHRHVHDLCARLEWAAERIEALETQSLPQDGQEVTQGEALDTIIAHTARWGEGYGDLSAAINDLASLARRLLSAQSLPQDGVPREPTKAMLTAAYDAAEHDTPLHIWRAMWDAAPKQDGVRPAMDVGSDEARQWQSDLILRTAVEEARKTFAMGCTLNYGESRAVLAALDKAQDGVRNAALENMRKLGQNEGLENAARYLSATTESKRFADEIRALKHTPVSSNTEVEEGAGLFFECVDALRPFAALHHKQLRVVHNSDTKCFDRPENGISVCLWRPDWTFINAPETLKASTKKAHALLARIDHEKNKASSSPSVPPLREEGGET